MHSQDFRILTTDELTALDTEINELSLQAEILDPSNSIESQELDQIRYRLTFIIQRLEQSYKLRRKEEFRKKFRLVLGGK